MFYGQSSVVLIVGGKAHNEIQYNDDWENPVHPEISLTTICIVL